MKTELEILKERIKEIENKQAICNHSWGKVTFEPQRKEIMREKIINCGVDIWTDLVPTGMYEEVDCWVRICTKCGKKQYAYEQEEVALKTIKRPKFEEER